MEPCQLDDEMSSGNGPEGCQPETDPMSGSTPSNRLAKRRCFIEGKASHEQQDLRDILSFNTRHQRTNTTIAGELSTAGQRTRPGVRHSSPGSTHDKAKKAKTTSGEAAEAGDATGDDEQAATSTSTRGQALVKKSAAARGAEVSGIVDATLADVEISSTPLPTDGTGVLGAYIERMKIDAHKVLYSIPTKQVPILDAYLASPLFTEERFSGIGDAIARSRASLPSRPVPQSKDNEVADNPEVIEAQNLLKPLIEELWQSSAVIWQWIKLVKPRLLDYGADGATRDALAELADLACDMDDTVQKQEDVPTGLYHRDRADYVIAMMGCDGDDETTSAYEKVIADHDWLCLYNARTTIVAIRDHYLALHDFVEKNAHSLANSKIFAKS